MAKSHRAWRIDAMTSKEIDEAARQEGVTPTQLVNEILAEGVRRRMAQRQIAFGIVLVGMAGVVAVFAFL